MNRQELVDRLLGEYNEVLEKNYKYQMGDDDYGLSTKEHHLVNSLKVIINDLKNKIEEPEMFERYIKEVKSQLTENCTEEYKRDYVTYTYSNTNIDENLEYFKDCMNKGLSPYKALLFFWDNCKV
jgi:hypothetical protein